MKNKYLLSIVHVPKYRNDNKTLIILFFRTNIRYTYVFKQERIYKNVNVLFYHKIFENMESHYIFIYLYSIRY